MFVMFVAAPEIRGAAVPADSPVRAKAFRSPGLDVHTKLSAADHDRMDDLSRLGVPIERSFVDPATGRWATLIPTHPLIPGNGRGNALTWGELSRVVPRDRHELAETIENIFVDYLTEYSDELRLSMDEIVQPLRIAVHGDTVLAYAAREIAGVPVRDSFINATISHGNLVLLGAARWADVGVESTPTIDEGSASATLATYLSDLEVSGHAIDGAWGDTDLLYVPFHEGEQLGYRLAYALKPQISDDRGRWEALVDAHSGALLSFTDTNHYATRHVVGGVYPETYDGDGPEGMEQLGWPMPYADLGGGLFFTDQGGNFPGEYTGEVETLLSGRYVRMIDNCGETLESSTGSDDIDFGGSDGDNCVTPPGASPGNTHAARTTYYETNRAFEWARSRVPDNPWLNSDPFQLFAKTNVAANCNAFWNGSLTFYQQGSGCGNMGEVAGIIDHEWGHGVDDNDNNPNISNPGEGIPDVYAALLLDTSCVGRGFFTSGNCSGYGDPCLDCSGIRDIDFARRASGEPHDVVWANANCGGVSHCRGAVYAEAVWDLRSRDLPSQFGMDRDRALEITSWLTLVGASNVGLWYTTVGDGEDGCGAEGGYLNYLAANDIDGDLSNGTPHMSAIFDAFDRHGIACSSPVVQDNGCETGPQIAPNIIVTPGDSSVQVSWDALPGNPSYHVFRTEGVKACDDGKIYIGRTNGTSLVDRNLLNGHEYFYTVAANAGGRSCLGPMSGCAAVTPAP